MAKHNVFILSLNEKLKRTSKLEVYSFRHTGAMNESYANRTGGLQVPDTFNPIKPFSFSGCLGSTSKAVSLLNIEAKHGTSNSMMQQDEASDAYFNKIENIEKLLEYLFSN